MPRRRRLDTVLAVLLLLAAGGLTSASPAAAGAYCGQVWGSGARSAAGMSAASVVDVRAGRHRCFDRLVLDLDAPLTGWSVRYVRHVVQDGSGRVVPVRGGARLAVVANAGVRHTDAWFARPGTLVDTRGYRTFRHVTWVGSFEGVTTVGLGVRARLPFRVFVLPGPGSGSRLVVDVGHRWCTPGAVRC